MISFCWPKSFYDIYTTFPKHKKGFLVMKTKESTSIFCQKKVLITYSSIDWFKQFQGQQSVPGHFLKPFQSSSSLKTFRNHASQCHGLHLFSRFVFNDLSIINMFWSYIHACYHICNVFDWFDWSLSAGMARCHC